MDTREYFEKIMQDYNQNRKGCSLRKYCKDEAVDYNWLMEYKKTVPCSKRLMKRVLDLKDRVNHSTKYELLGLVWRLAYVVMAKWMDKRLKNKMTIKIN